jgi:hypothetical protein
VVRLAESGAALERRPVEDPLDSANVHSLMARLEAHELTDF